MRILDRYLLLQLFLITFMLTIGFVSAGVLTRSLTLIDLMVNKGLPFGDFLTMLVLLIPNMVHHLLPVSAAIAVIFTFNKMHADNELVVSISAGISPWRIRWPGIILGVFIGVFLFANLGYIQPYAFSKFKDIEESAGVRFAASMIKPGQFVEFGEKQTLFIESFDSEGRMQGVMIRDESTKDRETTTFAAKGAIFEFEDKTILELSNVVQEGNDPNTGNPFTISSSRQVIDLAAGGENEEKKPRAKRAREHNLTALLKIWKDTKDDPKASGRHKRRTKTVIANIFVSPFLPLGLIVLCTNLLLTGHRDRRGLQRQIVFCVLNLILYLTLSILAREQSKQEDDGYLMMIAVIVSLYAFALMTPTIIRAVEQRPRIFKRRATA